MARPSDSRKVISSFYGKDTYWVSKARIKTGVFLLLFSFSHNSNNKKPWKLKTSLWKKQGTTRKKDFPCIKNWIWLGRCLSLCMFWSKRGYQGHTEGIFWIESKIGEPGSVERNLTKLLKTQQNVNHLQPVYMLEVFWCLTFQYPTNPLSWQECNAWSMFTNPLQWH